MRKAAESLDRAAEVDAYEPGHQKRLEMLRGKIDDNRFKVIASRFSSMADTAAAPLPNQEKMSGRGCLAGSDAAGGNSGAVRHAHQGG